MRNINSTFPRLDPSHKTMPPFTPVEGLVGGLLIGASVAGYAAINGRISGMSGQLSVSQKHSTANSTLKSLNTLLS